MNTANWNLEPHAAGPNPVADRRSAPPARFPPGSAWSRAARSPTSPRRSSGSQQHRQHLINYDPEAACYLPGVPRATYLPYPFQIVQGGNDDILMVYEYANANRVIEMRPVEPPPIDTWMGTSYGEWDGNTLVVKTLSQGPGEGEAARRRDGAQRGDLARPGRQLPGADHDGDRALHQVDETHIQYSATIDDPELYTRPWTISMPLYRHTEPNAQLLEFRCVPFSEQLLYGDLLEEK
jgi:hypothetical protein